MPLWQLLSLDIQNVCMMIHNSITYVFFRFDFTVTTVTFVIQLFEIGNPFLTFVIPLRFLRFVVVRMYVNAFMYIHTDVHR